MVAQSEVAVHAQHPEPWWVVVLLEPAVDVPSGAHLPSVSRPVTVDVVDGEELVLPLPAAGALGSTVMVESEHPQATSGLPSPELNLCTILPLVLGGLGAAGGAQPKTRFCRVRAVGAATATW